MTTRTPLLPRLERHLDTDSWAHPLPLGIIAAVLLTLGSFGGGATRNRGGLLETIGLEFLSYGHGAALSNTVFWLGTIMLAASWVMLGRRVVFSREITNSEQRLRLISITLLAWIIPLLFAGPMLSRDVYSYLMQGAMLRDGFDPYTQGAAVNPGPMLLEVSQDWRNTTTPYGPLHLWLGDGITRLAGDSVSIGVLCYKLISVAGFAAIAWAIPKLSRHLGGNPAVALWLGVANPVMVLHLVGGMHNESIMVGLVSLGLLAAARRRFFLSVGLIAVAVSLKATAAIALPFVVWQATAYFATQLRRPLGTRLRTLIAFSGSALIGAAETLLIVAAITWASGSSWGWVAEISGNSKVINPLAAPSAAAGIVTGFVALWDSHVHYNTILEFFRTISMVLMLLGLVLVWWLFRRGDRRTIQGTTAAYGVAYVFNSVTLPWYYASLISLLGVTPIPRLLAQWAVGFSLVITMAFSGSGNHQLYNVAWMVSVTLVAWAVTEFIFRRAIRADFGEVKLTEEDTKATSVRST